MVNKIRISNIGKSVSFKVFQISQVKIEKEWQNIDSSSKNS